MMPSMFWRGLWHASARTRTTGCSAWPYATRIRGSEWPNWVTPDSSSSRDALGDPGAASRALERALDLAEPDGIVLPFLLCPAPGLLERHARQRTAHASLVAEIRGLLAGNSPAAPSGGPQPPLEPLSNTEIRVLRYLPTNLSITEIANHLYVSPNTVKTHIRHLYEKLDTHRRDEAVACARALGLLGLAGRR
jgi:LuxR family maltose regulon positive regulatory protein